MQICKHYNQIEFSHARRCVLSSQQGHLLLERFVIVSVYTNYTHNIAGGQSECTHFTARWRRCEGCSCKTTHFSQSVRKWHFIFHDCSYIACAHICSQTRWPHRCKHGIHYTQSSTHVPTLEKITTPKSGASELFAVIMCWSCKIVSHPLSKQVLRCRHAVFMVKMSIIHSGNTQTCLVDTEHWASRWHLICCWFIGCVLDRTLSESKPVYWIYLFNC